MESVKEILEFKSYGRININLKREMDKKDINIYRMAKLTNLKYSTIKSYYNNEPLSRVDMDILAKMCYVLDCDISDLLEYVSD